MGGSDGDHDQILGEVDRVLGEAVHVLGEVVHVLGEVARVLGEVVHVQGEVARVLGEVDHVLGEVAHVLGEVAHVLGEVSQVRGGLVQVPGELDLATGSLNALRERAGDLSRCPRRRFTATNASQCVKITGDVLQERELRTEVDDDLAGLRGRPAKAVHVRRAGCDHPELDEGLGGDHWLVAARLRPTATGHRDRFRALCFPSDGRHGRMRQDGSRRRGC